MEYREGRCPKCNEVMQIPIGRDKIICMFCGQEFSVEEAREEEQAACREAIEHFRETAGSFFHNMEETAKGFHRNRYAESFENYCQRENENLKTINGIMKEAPDRAEAGKEVAEIIIGCAKEIMNGHKKKASREAFQMTLNMYMVTYVLPAILYTDAGLADLTDCICRKWSAAFKKSNIQAATFDSLKEGFRRKLCYITTAVCESLHKPRDCYELQVLKAYRDNYLSTAPGGEALIAQYYDLAPTIVKRVNKQKEHETIYRELYDTYISPCVRLIEEGENEACREKYQEMVERLQAEYINTAKEQKRDR